MTPHFNGIPIGFQETVALSAMSATAERMFAEGADEVRVRKLPSDRSPTRARCAKEPKRAKRASRKAQKRARRAQRR